MDDFTLKTARAVGTPSETAWAQVHVFDSFFIIVVLEKKDPATTVNLAACGKQILLNLEKSYQEDKKRNLASFRALLETLINPAAQDDVKVVTLVASMLIGKVLYIASQNGEVLIKRKEKIESVLKGSTNELVTASGFLEDDDLTILLTNELAQIIDSSKNEELFTPLDPQEIEEMLSAEIHKQTEQERLAAFIAKAKRQAFVEPQVETQTEQALPKPPLQLNAHAGVSYLRKLFKVGPVLLAGKSRRVIITVFFMLATLFVSSLVFGVEKRQRQQNEARFTKTYTLALQKYDEGMALSDLNPQLSAKTLREGKETIDGQLQNFSEKSEERKKLSDLKNKIEDGLKVALKINTVTDASVFFDLTLIKEGAIGTSMSLFESKILILDNNNRALYTLTIPTKQSDFVAASLKGPRVEAIGATNGFIFDDEGIEQIVLKTRKKDKVIEKDDAWGEIVDVISFAGNLYLLDKDKGMIYKYQATENGFAGRRNYLAADVKPDFKNSVSMAIDGAIWVLFSDGRTNKYIQGAPQAFSIISIDRPLNGPSALFTSDEAEHLYILDKGNKRVVVVNKDGAYNSQYQWEGIKDVSDIVVSEKEKKILLLSGSKIYAMDIRL